MTIFTVEIKLCSWLRCWFTKNGSMGTWGDTLVLHRGIIPSAPVALRQIFKIKHLKMTHISQVCTSSGFHFLRKLHKRHFILTIIEKCHSCLKFTVLSKTKFIDCATLEMLHNQSSVCIFHRLPNCYRYVFDGLKSMWKLFSYSNCTTFTGFSFITLTESKIVSLIVLLHL